MKVKDVLQFALNYCMIAERLDSSYGEYKREVMQVWDGLSKERQEMEIGKGVTRYDYMGESKEVA
jgi:hypothetical protein